MSKTNALEIPPAVEGDPKSHRDRTHLGGTRPATRSSSRRGLWADAGNWGIMLVDLARHVANAYEQDGRGRLFRGARSYSRDL